MDLKDWSLDPAPEDGGDPGDFESLSRLLRQELGEDPAPPEESPAPAEPARSAPPAEKAPSPGLSWLDQLIAFADEESQRETAAETPPPSLEQGAFPVQRPRNLPEPPVPEPAVEKPAAVGSDAHIAPPPEAPIETRRGEGAAPYGSAEGEAPAKEEALETPEEQEIPEELRIPVTQVADPEPDPLPEPEPEPAPAPAPEDSAETPVVLAYPFKDLNYPVRTPSETVEVPETAEAPFEDWDSVFSVTEEAPAEAAPVTAPVPAPAPAPEPEPPAPLPEPEPLPLEEPLTPADHGPGEDFRIETDYRQDFGEYDRIRPIQLDRHHRTGCLGGILYFLFILVCGCLLGAVLWLAAVDVLAINKPAREVEITIPENFTLEEVSTILYDQGLINYKPLFGAFAKFAKAQEKIEPGVYHLKTSYDYRALVSSMSSYSGTRVETEVTIPEGYNLFQIFEKLEEEGVCTQDKLWEAAQNASFDYDFLAEAPEGQRLRLEGYLFPDTYKFYVNDDPERVLNKMLRNFDHKLTPEYRERAQELGFSLREIITVASMIEKETGRESERAAIASVIYNRLSSEDFPNLQIDATFFYAAQAEGVEPGPGVESPYNTYLVEGLPAGPITNPGITSIKAALYPETTNYTYYAATVDYTTRFFTNYNDFRKFVESDEFQGNGG